ncbi:MAG: TIGR00730 family Rossman fold protein [Cyclobacteriaceae bacterium]
MNICVFCGSSEGNLPIFKEAALNLGALIGKKGHQLIYGGADIGLMGALADSVLENGGKVTGIIPSFLFEKEIAHRGISELITVNSMHERKMRMASLADAFIALPGGWGTLEELAEILTWKQLHLINKPVAVLNTNEFFSPLIAMMESMVQHGFLGREHFKKLIISSTPEELSLALGF